MKNVIRWDRRNFLRLSMQAVGALGINQAVGHSTSGAVYRARADSQSVRLEGNLVISVDTPWILPRETSEPIQRALSDVRRDWYKVFGHVPILLTEPPSSWRGPVICLGYLPPQPEDHFVMARESFTLEVQTIDGGLKAIVATGADMRGAIYAIYAFSEQILQVDPWWYWAEKEPLPRTTISIPADFKQRCDAPTFRYRGWFINDEDLLSGFRPDPLRENVYSLEMLDRICETLLRLRGNLLVPATDAFADERCQEFTARRGLVLNMHHFNVVGLNTWRWPTDVPFSYSKHPAIMERYWQDCVDTLKDKEVVWTVGYRGKDDRPFWEDEPELKTPEARGDVITRAIAKQVEIVRRAQPDAFIISNMWMEGASLYRENLITIPPGVTLVWADNGAGFMRDNGSVKAGQGMYYHTMMLDGLANQLSEFVPPERIYHEMARFTRAGATEFFLVNVSDIRPVPMTTECAMRFAWDASPYLGKSDKENQHAFLLEWSVRQFGRTLSLSIANIWRDYFAIFDRQPKVTFAEAFDIAPAAEKTEGQLPEDDGFGSLPQGDNAPHSYLSSLSDVALPIIRGKQALTNLLRSSVQHKHKFATANSRRFSPLLAKANALAERVPANRRSFYSSHVIAAIAINLYSNEMLRSYCEALEAYSTGNRAGTINCFERALVAIDASYDVMHRAELGQWATWYIGEGFVGLDHSRDLIRLSIAAARGEPPPPVRSGRDYPQLYQYQEKFKSNFPLLYGPRDQ